MLENCKNAQERWGGVNSIIDKWLQSRQELLVLFCDISAAIDEQPIQTQANNVRQLCQLVVDYVSAGHFEVYDQLVKEGQAFNDNQGLSQASKLYSEIDQTTGFILDFNDKYLETDDLEALPNDLSILGEKLAIRFEGEDQMIQVLHNAHKNKVA